MGVIKGPPRSAVDPSTNAPRRQFPNNNRNGGGGGNNADFLLGSDSDGAGDLLPPALIVSPQQQNVQQEHEALVASFAHLRRRPARPRMAAIPTDTTPPPHSSKSSRQKSGAKKCRRYENQLILLKNSELEGDEMNEVSFDDLSPFNSAARRTFGRLLEEVELLSVWNLFMEAKQETTIHEKSLKNSGNNSAAAVAATHRQQSQSSAEAFNGICRRLRSMLRQRHLPLGMMDNLEEDLVEYFLVHPLGTFESSPLDSFRRGLLHALSQYNNLCSYSIHYDKSKKNKVVRVQNKGSEFSPPPVRLVQYIETTFHGITTAAATSGMTSKDTAGNQQEALTLTTART